MQRIVRARPHIIVHSSRTAADLHAMKQRNDECNTLLSTFACKYVYRLRIISHAAHNQAELAELRDAVLFCGLLLSTWLSVSPFQRIMKQTWCRLLLLVREGSHDILGAFVTDCVFVVCVTPLVTSHETLMNERSLSTVERS